MTTIASMPTPSSRPGVNAAKRKMFQSHDLYGNYYGRSAGGAAKPSSSCTIYGSAFSPERRNKKYFVACTSNGYIAVWDPRPSAHTHASLASQNCSSAPILSVHVGGETRKNQVLYDLQFIETNNGEHLLVASGDPGVVVYRWSDFEAAIDIREGADTEDMSSKKPKCQDPPTKQSSTSKDPFAEIRPISTFQPHPSPATSFGEAIEINSTSYSKSDGVLYGAAGDVFGCYSWDLATEKLIGTFGGASRFDGGGHRDYLHVVKTIPDEVGIGSRYVITGGEDGNVGFWDGKDRKLIQMMNIQSTMDKNKDLLKPTTTPNSRSFISNASTPWNNGSSLWVSSMDTCGNWLAVCGGAETTINTLTSRSGPNSSGFMALWHLPTRTFTSGCVTRESMNAVVYNSSLDCFVSGGNEGRLSFWDSTTMTRSGRSWCSPPATYTTAVDSGSDMMIVGGSGGTLDCFADRVKVKQLHFTSQ